MIPRIVHYCWFGKKPLSSEILMNIESWKKFNPNFKLRLWNEKNSPMTLTYMKVAKFFKYWSNMSNFIRLYSLSLEGGIYLDTDVECLHSFEELLSYKCFFGFQQNKKGQIESQAVNSAICGAEKGNPFIKELLNKFLKKFSGIELSYLSGPKFITDELIIKGLLNHQYEENKIEIDGITLFPHYYFYPYPWDGELNPHKDIKTNTYCIHKWNWSWKNEQTFQGRILRKFEKIKPIAIKKFINIKSKCLINLKKISQCH